MLIVSTHKKVWSINLKFKIFGIFLLVFLDVLFPVFSFSKASSFNAPDIFIHNLLNLGDVRNVVTTIL